MEKHFLADMMAEHGEPGFKAEPWYYHGGDYINYKMANEAAVANWIDKWLTIYESEVDGRPIGFLITNVHSIIRKFGLLTFTMPWKGNAENEKDVSISRLLLAAYEEGPPVIGRRNAYAVAMEFPMAKWSIPASELQRRGQ